MGFGGQQKSDLSLYGDFDKEMLKVLKSVKDFQATPVQKYGIMMAIVLAYERKDLIFVFNFNPKQSFTDYGFLVTPELMK